MVRIVSSFPLRKIDQNNHIKKILFIQIYEKFGHFFIFDVALIKVFKEKQFCLGILAVYTLENIMEQFSEIC